MNVFLWEALCAGASGEDIANSLLQEGRAMLTALATDVLQIADCRVTLLLRSGLDFPLEESAGRLQIVNCTPDDEPRRFQQLAAEADRCWIIAPEIDGLLSDRRRIAAQAGGRCIGPSIDATDLCSDKLRLSDFLIQSNLPTAPTISFSRGSTSLPFAFPVVVKPRLGAGSVGCRVISGQREFEELCALPHDEALIVQPFVPGEALSTVAIASHDGEAVEVFPTAKQHLSDDGQLRYRGGELPAPERFAAIVESLVRRACRTIPGLRGYVGFDLIRPLADPGNAILIEINPRLTTSYIGYRELTTENLAERVLFPERYSEPIRWNNTRVRYFPDGRVDCHRPQA